MRSLLIALFITFSAGMFAQTIVVNPTELAFLQSTTIINFKVDFDGTKMGSFKSIAEWVEFRYNEVKLKENEAEAKEWKAAWEEALAGGVQEFREDFNAKFETAAVRLKEGATTVEYTAVFKVDRINVPEGFGNKPVEVQGQLLFYNKAGKLLSTVEIMDVKSFPSGGIPMRVRSGFRRAGGHTGEKIYLMYFK